MTPTLRWFSRCCTIISLCALAACGSEGAAPITPTSIVVTGGDGQAGPFGQELAQPLTALVTGSDDHPLAGAEVQWAVTAGTATLAQPADTSDAKGETANRLTPGFVAGDVTVSATVTGLPPATFTAHVVNPCDYRPVHVLGGTDSGALRSLDCRRVDGSFIDYYSMAVSGQQSFSMSLKSESMDALLLLGDPADNLLAFSDDSSATNTNSFVRMIAARGDYSIGVNSFSASETGPYELESTIGAVSLENCADDVWVTRGISTVQHLASTDCVATPGPPYYGDLYFLVLLAGQQITVSQTSTSFDAYLELYGFDFASGTFVVVASDDNSGGGTDAQLTYTAPRSNYFFIAASSAISGEVGAYTLAIAPPVAIAAAPQVTSPGDRLLVDPSLFKARRAASRWSRRER